MGSMKIQRGSDNFTQLEFSSIKVELIFFLILLANSKTTRTVSLSNLLMMKRSSTQLSYLSAPSWVWAGETKAIKDGVIVLATFPV